MTKLALPPLLLGWAGVAFMTSASEASADTPDTMPPFAIAARETFDMFGVPAGVRPGAAILNKLQISATVRGDELGFAGWSIHGQMFRSDGKSLSRRMGDIQTADNIEAVPVTRLSRLIWRRCGRPATGRSRFVWGSSISTVSSTRSIPQV